MNESKLNDSLRAKLRGKGMLIEVNSVDIFCNDRAYARIRQYLEIEKVGYVLREGSFTAKKLTFRQIEQLSDRSGVTGINYNRSGGGRI